MSEQDVQAEVMKKYPKIERERHCRTDRAFRNKLREEYAEKLRKQSALTYETKEGEQIRAAEIR